MLGQGNSSLLGLPHFCVGGLRVSAYSPLPEATTSSLYLLWLCTAHMSRLCTAHMSRLRTAHLSRPEHPLTVFLGGVDVCGIGSATGMFAYDTLLNTTQLKVRHQR